MTAQPQAQGARSQRNLELTKYEVFEEIGHGGMATVYRGLDRRLGREVALKVIHPHLRDSAEVARRFAAEARAVAKLRHPNIVEVYDVSAEDEREQYLVVELLRGCTLRKLLEDNGALPPEIAGALVLELTHALAHAHDAGVIHRDVKPENVLLEHRAITSGAAKATTGATIGAAANATPSSPSAAPSSSASVSSGAGGTSGKEPTPGDRVTVKLTDFGIAKLLDAQGVTSTGQVLGSPAHMAPEQIEGGEVDVRADVFACGVLFYECIVGHLPFRGNNPAQVLRRVLEGSYPSAEREEATVGKRWSAIVDRALGHMPDDRYPTVTALGDAIAEELARVGVSPEGSSTKRELEAYLDDPTAYREAHKARMVTTLASLADRARKNRDVLGAAADYNRALAYAPNDPELLRVMTRMHRSERRRRIALRTAPLLAVLLVGIGSYAVARTLKKNLPRPVPSVIARTDAPPDPNPAIDAGVATPSASSKPAASATTTARTYPLPAPIVKSVHRQLYVDTLVPAFGVVASLDGADAKEAHEGAFVLLNDDKPHQLRFACQQNLCEPRLVEVANGTDDVHLGEVRMKIRDATLVVDGNPANHYQITQFPQIACRSGMSVKLPMRRRDDEVDILELETNRSHRAALTAGQIAHVAFAGN